MLGLQLIHVSKRATDGKNNPNEIDYTSRLHIGPTRKWEVYATYVRLQYH